MQGFQWATKEGPLCDVRFSVSQSPEKRSPNVADACREMLLHTAAVLASSRKRFAAASSRSSMLKWQRMRCCAVAAAWQRSARASVSWKRDVGLRPDNSHSPAGGRLSGREVAAETPFLKISLSSLGPLLPFLKVAYSAFLLATPRLMEPVMPLCQSRASLHCAKAREIRRYALWAGALEDSGERFGK